MSTAAKAKFSKKNVEPVEELLVKVVAAFPGQFMYLAPNNIEAIFNEGERAKNFAQAKVLRGFIEAITPKNLAILVHRATWEVSSEHERALALYEQLMAFDYDTEKGTYKIRKPDVQKFSEWIALFGMQGEKAKDVFDAAFSK